jgi:glutamine---fructose-6-phosphate transaminase (isomerizing)
MASRMATEIAEQPEAIERTLDVLLPQRADIRRLADGRRQLLIVARGSSDNAGVYGRYLLEVHAGLGATLAAPSLATHYAVLRDLSDTVVLSLSQSGGTEEVVATQAWAVACGARTIAITNVETSELARQANLALTLAAGPELAVPATKTYTAQLAAIAVVADALGTPDRTLEPDLRRVPGEMARMLEQRQGIAAAIDELIDADHTLVVGRGIMYGTALEVALKLEETCLKPVRGLSYADFRHGPIAVTNAATVAVLISAADGPMTSGMTALAADLGRLGALTVGIGGDPEFAASCSVPVAGPVLCEAVTPLALALPAQLIVEGLARSRGLNPDRPRSLNKVTQTDRNQTL